MSTRSGILILLTAALALTAAIALGAPPLLADLAPARLRCEYRENPLGIDATSPRLSWIVTSGERAQVQTAYRVLAASSESLLAGEKGDLWDSGKVSSRETTHIAWAGAPLRSGRRVHWKVRVWDRDDRPSAWSEPAFFQAGILDPSEWKGRWIGSPGPAPRPEDPPGPGAYLRKTFRLNGPVRRATAHASALGVYELRLNGRRVGEQVLAPEWTDYHRRVQYQTHDVTALLREGENAIGAILGDGWYSGKLGIHWIVPNGPARRIYGPRPLFFLQLEVELADGSKATVVSDGTWKLTLDGPIRKACILDGETVDASREMPGWDAPGFDDTARPPATWQPAAEAQGVTVRLVAQPNEPIRVIEERRPAALTEPSPGVFVFDLGQNIVGWCRLATRGPAGTRLTLRHAEVLGPDGNIYTANLRGAAQLDEFILRGDGDETFEPRFTYHGFRYVEVKGLAAKPALEALTGRVVHSSAPPAGVFECSDPVLTRLMENIAWTQRGNMHSTPTDCPQRDERLGWMGDAQVYSQTACFQRDMAAFFTKWLRDVRDDQAADGRFPDFAPHPYDSNARFSAAPAWADAGVIVPWRVYVNYGDRRILEESFDAARRWVEYVRSQSPDLIWTKGRGNDYNDWLNGNTLVLEGWPKTGAEVPKEVFATAFFAHSTEILSRMARVLGRTEDAANYGALAARIKEAFRRAFVKEDGTILGDTQAGYALALHFDLLPEGLPGGLRDGLRDDLRGAAAKRMVDGIAAYKGHASTGIQSTIRMLLELTRSGYDDVAYRLVMSRTIPSWLYMVEHGGTTVWERWDGWVEGRGFQDPGMNSFNHYAFGSVGEWIWRAVIGLSPDEDRPGYEHFTVRPRPGGGLTWARGRHDSIRGRIDIQWKIDGSSFVLELTVPANTAAAVHVPATIKASIVEGGGPAEKAHGVKLLRREEREAVFEVGSGKYEFVVKEPAP